METLLLIMSIKLKKNYCTITNQIERVKGENKEKEREKKETERANGLSNFNNSEWKIKSKQREPFSNVP